MQIGSTDIVSSQPYQTMMFNQEYVKTEQWIPQTTIDRRNYPNTVNTSSNNICLLQQELITSSNSAPFERYKSDKLCINRLGGQYSSGRPLPMPVREKIVELAKSGLKPCQISKQLQVSHGCVSKLLTRWRKTGSVQPERIGGSTPKKVLPYVATAIKVYKRWRPHLQTWQIRQRLITDGVCTPQNVPSISSINKTLRCQISIKPDSPIKVESENCRDLKPPTFHTQFFEKMPQAQQPTFVGNVEYDTNYRNVLEPNNNTMQAVHYSTPMQRTCDPQQFQHQYPNTYQVHPPVQHQTMMNNCQVPINSYNLSFSESPTDSIYYKYPYDQDGQMNSPNLVYM